MGNCTCGMADLKRPCKLTCDTNKISSDCDVCRRPLEEHLKDGTHPPAWMWDRITDLENSLATHQVVLDGTQRRLKDAERHVQEHIDDKHRILREYEEKVKALKDELDGKTRSLEIERKWHTDSVVAHKADRQAIIEHTDASAIVKTVFGLVKTDPMDDQLFEIACQRVMSAMKVYNSENTPKISPKDSLWTPGIKLHEAIEKIRTALRQMVEISPGSGLMYLRIALVHIIESMEFLANSEASKCRTDGYKEGRRDARNGCVCDKQPGKCPTHDILIDRHVEALGTDE